MRFPLVLTLAYLAASCSSASHGGQTGEEQTTGDSAIADPATTQQALMSRWNASADEARTSVDFHWPTYDQFPHPTFKMGTEEAYQQFATVLLLFFRQSFDFLAQQHLFQTPLRYVFPSGQVGLDTTFQKLATDFSSGNASAAIPDSTRQELGSFLDRM